MRPTVRARLIRLVGAGALAGSLLLPAAGPAAAADPVVLRVGTTQDFDASNPYQTALVSGYEAFQLTYNLLVDFGPDRAGARLRRLVGACARQGHVPHPDRDEVVRRRSRRPRRTPASAGSWRSTRSADGRISASATSTRT